MSNCCGNNNTETENNSSISSIEIENKEPKNFIERFFWKIGKEDAEKNSENKKSCCS